MPGIVVCRANEVLFVSGMFHSRPKVVTGRTFVIPGLQKVQRLSLSTLTLNVTVENQMTSDGVLINADGVTQVKINGDNQEMLMMAAETLLSKSEDELKVILTKVMQGHMAAVIGLMSAEKIQFDKRAYSKAVFEVAASDLINLGVSIISFTVKTVYDDKGYFVELGRKRLEEAKAEQEKRGEFNTHTARYANKLKEMDEKKPDVTVTSASVAEKAEELKLQEIDLKEGREEKTYTFTGTGDLYKGYDWSAEPEFKAEK